MQPAASKGQPDGCVQSATRTSNRGTQVDVKMCDVGVTCDIWRVSPEDKDDDDYDASYDDDDDDCDLDEDIMYGPSKYAMSGEDEEGEYVNVKWV